MEPFLSYSRYLKQKYGTKAYRVAIDAGFSCPNRGRDRLNEGCSFCDQAGSLATYQNSTKQIVTDGRLIDRRGREDIAEQIKRGVGFLKKRYDPEVFLLYLQAFSNTYAPVEELKELYDFCLSQYQFRELIIATRPDCVSPGIADLIASYIRDDFDVWVELGLQSAHDETLGRIGRGHTVADFEESYHALVERGVLVAAHMIFGLPGESEDMIMDTVKYVARLEPAGVKIHDLHVVAGTRLHRQYLEGEVAVASRDEHMLRVANALPLLPAETVILRITCDTPAEKLVAPLVKYDKQPFVTQLRRYMIEQKLQQGARFFHP